MAATADDLWLQLVTARGGDADADRDENRAELAAFLADRIAEAQRAWPDVRVSSSAFVVHLARHLAEGDILEALGRVRIADLLLACGCARGDETSVRTFETTFAGEFRIVKARLRKSVAEAEDFAQGCRQRLFSPPRPKIADYSGQGDLRNWLRVSLVRMLIDHQRATRRRDATEQLTEPGPSLDIPTPGHDVELEFLKQKYGAAFREAFEQAAMALSPGERNLLRQHFSDGLTVDEIGALHGVHRATAARRVAKARSQLFAGTRRTLMDNLGLNRSELDSVMRMIESNVHVSVQRILTPTG